MNRSEEQSALDRKIARIRKQNEEIIKRKQVIDEEIKKAERHNAVVNVKKSYSDDENDAPRLYSDSVSTRQKKTVVYPKIVSKINQTDRRRGEEDAVWRREREQIDNERVRRQKAASGWRREWDADKIFDLTEESQSGRPQHDTNLNSRGRRERDANKTFVRTEESRSEKHQHDTNWNSRGRQLRENKDDDSEEYQRDTSWNLQGRQLRENGDDDGVANRVISYRSKAKKLSDGDDNNWQTKRTPSYRSHERKVTATLDELDNVPQYNPKEFEDKKSSDQLASMDDNETKDSTLISWRTSGPLNLRKPVAVKDVPNIKISKVTKFSETKALKPVKPYLWKNDFSHKEEEGDSNSSTNLSQRFENIVIRVNKEDKKRTVEVFDKPQKNEGTMNVLDDPKYSLSKINTQSHLESNDAFARSFTFVSNSAPCQPKIFTFGDCGKSLGFASRSSLELSSQNNDLMLSPEATKVSPPTGILKKSSEIPSTDKSWNDDFKPKKSVKIRDEFSKDKIKTNDDNHPENDDDDDDENWEDVSDDDEEWEDVVSD